MTKGMIAHLSPKERFGYACLVGVLLFAFGYIGARHLRQPAAIVFETSPSASPNTASQGIAASTSPATSKVAVHVAGAVKYPGVFRLTDGSRVVDAVHAAGGPAKGADLDAINLAAKLIDGSQLRIPTKSQVVATSHPKKGPKTAKPEIDKSGAFTPVTIEPTYLAANIAPNEDSSEAKTKPSTSRSKKVPANVDVNTATADQLLSLPGVGPSTAQKIVDFRQQHGPFKTVDDLLDVPSIGEKKLEKMRPFVKL